ncbi:MAG: hypothetical protein IPJ07_01770 [Acidobacteria bacterium]|nr:hypothetical protein [Acidobacteriota bacterium]
MMTWVEKLSSGATINAKGDWTSDLDSLHDRSGQDQGQNLKLKRTLGGFRPLIHCH